MIIKAQTKQKAKAAAMEQAIVLVAPNPNTIVEKVFRIPKPKEKRYLIVVMPCEGKIAGYVYDIHEQRLVYRSLSSKSPEDTFDTIYKDYKKSDTRVVDPEILLNVIKDVEAPQISFTFVNNKKLADEIVRSRPQPESFHIKKIRETYKFIDKYKVNLKVKVEHHKENNKATIYLFDEEAGVSIGTHRLEYDYTKGRYIYYYCTRVVCDTNELENIFKTK